MGVEYLNIREYPTLEFNENWIHGHGHKHTHNTNATMYVIM